MFGSRLILIGVALLALLVAVLGAARPTSGAPPETRVVDPAPGGAVGETYVVKPGDSLWAIAERRYGGDPREGVWRIRERNGLAGSGLQPGQVLVLP